MTADKIIIAGYTRIREYGSTLYVGMARKTNGCPYISIVSDEPAQISAKIIETSLNKHIPFDI